MSGQPAGGFDRWVTIERIAGQVAGPLGEPEPVWGVLAELKAAVLPVSDGERWRAQQGQVAAVVTHRFRIPWGLGVGPLDRLRFEGREFEISGVKELGRRVGQEITAAARAE